MRPCSQVKIDSIIRAAEGKFTWTKLWLSAWSNERDEAAYIDKDFIIQSMSGT